MIVYSLNCIGRLVYRLGCSHVNFVLIYFYDSLFRKWLDKCIIKKLLATKAESVKISLLVVGQGVAVNV